MYHISGGISTNVPDDPAVIIVDSNNILNPIKYGRRMQELMYSPSDDILFMCSTATATGISGNNTGLSPSTAMFYNDNYTSNFPQIPTNVSQMQLANSVKPVYSGTSTAIPGLQAFEYIKDPSINSGNGWIFAINNNANTTAHALINLNNSGSQITATIINIAITYNTQQPSATINIRACWHPILKKIILIERGANLATINNGGSEFFKMWYIDPPTTIIAGTWDATYIGDIGRFTSFPLPSPTPINPSILRHNIMSARYDPYDYNNIILCVASVRESYFYRLNLQSISTANYPEGSNLVKISTTSINKGSLIPISTYPTSTENATNRRNLTGLTFIKQTVVCIHKNMFVDKCYTTIGTLDATNAGALDGFIRSCYMGKTNKFVRIRKNALGQNIPSDDLLLTPNHPILHNGEEIIANNLVNNETIIHEIYDNYIEVYALLLKERKSVKIHNVDVMQWGENDYNEFFTKKVLQWRK